MEVTSVRVRPVKSNNIIAIASVTLDEQLIINDIKVGYDYSLIMPNSNSAQRRGQFSIMPYNSLYSMVQKRVIEKLQEFY